jgi:CBS domain-containing protein
VDLTGPDESVQAAAERMHQHTVGALLVLDADKKPSGIVPSGTS